MCEVAASSASIDLHDKLNAYRRNGIAEYLVWVVAERRIRWFALGEQEYVEMKERSGVVVSRVFSKLALDVKGALIRSDVDRFIEARLKKEQLAPAPEASPAALIRRVTFDLTGLPPTPEEADAFLDGTNGPMGRISPISPMKAGGPPPRLSAPPRPHRAASFSR